MPATVDTSWPKSWPVRAKELHVFDPRGDLLLLLTRSTKGEELSELEYPVEEEPELIEDEDLEYVEEEVSSTAGEIDPPAEDPAVEASPWLEEDLPPTEGDPESVEWDAALQEEVAPQEEEAPPAEEEPEPAQEEAIDDVPEDVEVQMRVSSKYLMLASPNFSTLLSSDTVEGRRLRTKGSVVLSLPDENPDAMIILMNIIHLRSREVPRILSYTRLAQVAVIVDRREMLDAVSFHSSTWIEHLVKKGSVPTKYGPAVIQWLFISWVFRDSRQFKSISHVIEGACGNGVEKDCSILPIPHSIIETLRTRRRDSLQKVMQKVHDSIMSYTGFKLHCGWHDRWEGYATDSKLTRLACDSMVLGSLIKASAKIGIWPMPSEPDPKVSFNSLKKRIRQMKILYGQSCGEINDGHGVADIINTSINAIEESLSGGLDLNSFLPEDQQVYA